MSISYNENDDCSTYTKLQKIYTETIKSEDIEKFRNEKETIDKYKKRFKERWKEELDKIVKRMKEEL